MSSRTVTANHRRRIWPLAVVTTVCVIVLAALIAWPQAQAARRVAHRASAVPGFDVPFKRVTAKPFKRLSLGKQYESGRLVANRFIVGPRVFTDASHGFGIAAPIGAQWPAVTEDGGRTWRIAGPYLHVDAADAGDAFSQIGAASRRLLFAGGGANNVDTTPDGGRHWYQAYLATGTVLGITWDRFSRELLAFVQPLRHHGPLPTWTYVSKDGIHWKYTTTLGG